MSTSTPAQPEPTGQDQQAPQETPAEALKQQPPQPQGDGPWAADLNLIFQDEAVRSQVDQFLRSKVQPYTTQLEQQTAQAQDAMNLWNKLGEDPVNTYVAMTEEMYGPDAAKAMMATIQQQLAQQQNQQQAQQGQQPPPDPRVENALSYIEQQQNETYYNNEIARIGADPANQDIDTEMLHPFVAAASGDFNEAVKLYRSYQEQWNQKHGPLTGDLGLNQPPPEPPPPVIASDTASAAQSSTPVEPKAQTLDDAINEFMAENRANREAPPVS